ncbi:MAG: ABC transporter ATP-binding protein/permease, partial [Alphaproteobacteria bacterium]|nr:ABC transporter ATP-binding protein/permease [Alphaproteobacteria bacterium]
MARPLTEEGDGAPSFRPLYMLLPYLWPEGRGDLKARVAASLVCMVFAKMATVLVPYLFGRIVDSLNGPMKVAAAGLALIAAYTLARILMQAFAQLRDGVFAKVAYHALRQVGVSTFAHVHTLSLRFHLERKTGGLSRVIDRGTKGIDTLLSFVIFSIFPTILELALDAAILWIAFGVSYAIVTTAMVIAYIWFTFAITRWRIKFRRVMNESDTDASTKAVDSLLNYETVKYFNNEEFEAGRYDENLRHYEAAQVKTEASLGLLNIGQSFIIAIAVTALMALAASGVAQRALTIGDLVLVNALLIQLYIPLNHLGMVYREIKQSLIDMDRMFRLLEENREIADRPGARTLPPGPASIRFDHVDFCYDPKRQILFDVAFDIPAGSKVAVVGHSGSGKSTLARLLYRFYDVSGGAVRINGVDLRDLTQASLRAAIGIVPQDTVLFNDSIFYNIQYGRPEAAPPEVLEAARAAHIHDFVETLPDGYETRVGERGLKLSGGEKQRVAIART